MWFDESEMKAIYRHTLNGVNKDWICLNCLEITTARNKKSLQPTASCEKTKPGSSVNF